jgi:hypothetical protein
MQQRMAVLAAPQNRVGKNNGQDDFQRKGKERKGNVWWRGVVRGGGGAQVQNGKGTKRMGWRRVPGIETENEKLKRTIPLW